LKYTSRSLGNIKSWKKIQEGIEGQTEESPFQVQVYSPNIIRINISPDHRFDFHSYSVIATPDTDGVNFRIGDNEEVIDITTDELTLQIRKAPLRFNFYTKDNKLINCEDPGLGTTIEGSLLTSFKKLHADERFIGMGEKAGNLDRRGTGISNWNTDNFGYGRDSDPSYSSFPFYIGLQNGLIYGIFLDNTSKSHFNFGASNDRFSSFSVEQGNLNYYFIYGKSVAEVIKEYTFLTGRMELPPLWSLGYHQCRYSYFPDSEVYTLAKTFRDKKIPCDTIVFDIHYMDAYKIFTWNKERFPNPKGMIAALKEKGFEVTLICDPGIKVEDDYEPYEEGKKEDIFLKLPDGTEYTAEVWPGWCNFPDFTDKKGRAWWIGQLKHYADLGVEGYWNDMNEIASWGNFMPNAISFNYEGEKTSSRMARNIYGFQMARSAYEGAKKHLDGKRPFNLTRAAFAGVQRYSAMWTGDNSASDDHMILGVRLQNSLGLSGVPFTGNDIGGFHYDSSPQLYARWIALGAFSPFFRGHSMVNTGDSEPWSYGEGVEEIARNYINLRYSFLPYLYSVFHESSQTGIPVVRSLAIELPFDDKIYDKAFQNQYLFGPNILVAPVSCNQEIAKVYLPPGDWYELDNGKRLEGGKVLYLDTPIYKLPLFVRASSVIPSQEVVQSMKDDPGKELILHVYNGIGQSAFEYYEDDGSSYSYQNDEFYSRIIYFEGTRKALRLEEVSGSISSKFKEVRLVLHGFASGQTFMKNDLELQTTSGTWQFMADLVEYDPLGEERNMHSEDVLFTSFSLENEEIIISWP
jgi:alpha-glucosidase